MHATDLECAIRGELKSSRIWGKPWSCIGRVLILEMLELNSISPSAMSAEKEYPRAYPKLSGCTSKQNQKRSQKDRIVERRKAGSALGLATVEA